MGDSPNYGDLHQPAWAYAVKILTFKFNEYMLSIIFLLLSLITSQLHITFTYVLPLIITHYYNTLPVGKTRG